MKASIEPAEKIAFTGEEGVPREGSGIELGVDGAALIGEMTTGLEESAPDKWFRSSAPRLQTNRKQNKTRGHNKMELEITQPSPRKDVKSAIASPDDVTGQHRTC
eukprot:EG_transcript_51827